MSDQGAEGQVPEPPGLEGRGEMPPRPTVRESFRRGLFVRLPTEGEAEEGLAESEQGQGIADQYPEQVADPYPGWRQAADGSWEAVSPEAIAYVESTEQAAPETAYPEIDQSANYASVAGGEPFIHDKAAAEVPAWTFTPEQDLSQVAEEAPVAEVPQEPEFASEPVLESAPEAAPEPAAEVAAEPAAEVAPVTEAAPGEPVPEAAPETVSEAPAEVAPAEAAEAAPSVVPVPVPVAEAAAAPESAATATELPDAASSADDAVAGTGLYIPSDVELLEGDMPVYGESENVPPRFAGSGLGEPFFIEFADLARTLTGLRRLLPKGTRLTYNYDYERAWVRTSAEIDLSSFAERIEAPAAESEIASS